MKFRKKMSRSASRKNFRKKSGVHKKNTPRYIMRGGIRLH